MNNLLNDLISYYKSQEDIFNKNTLSKTTQEEIYVSFVLEIKPKLISIRNDLINKNYDGAATRLSSIKLDQNIRDEINEIIKNLRDSNSAYEISEPIAETQGYIPENLKEEIANLIKSEFETMSSKFSKVEEIIVQSNNSNSGQDDDIVIDYLSRIEGKLPDINSPDSIEDSINLTVDDIKILKEILSKLQGFEISANNVLEIRKSIESVSLLLEKTSQQVKEHATTVNETFKGLVDSAKTTTTSAVTSFCEMAVTDITHVTTGIKQTLEKAPSEFEKILSPLPEKINASITDAINKPLRTNMLLFGVISLTIILGCVWLTSRLTGVIISEQLYKYNQKQQQITTQPTSTPTNHQKKKPFI